MVGASKARGREAGSFDSPITLGNFNRAVAFGNGIGFAGLTSHSPFSVLMTVEPMTVGR